MTATVHKILVHGPQIIESSLLPVGCLGENASEARNKYYKRDRILHARKNSRVNNLTDVFHRALDSSDPYLSHSLPSEVIAFLVSPKPEDAAQVYSVEDELTSIPFFDIDLEEERLYLYKFMYLFLSFR